MNVRGRSTSILTVKIKIRVSLGGVKYDKFIVVVKNFGDQIRRNHCVIFLNYMTLKRRNLWTLLRDDKRRV